MEVQRRTLSWSARQPSVVSCRRSPKTPPKKQICWEKLQGEKSDKSDPIKYRRYKLYTFYLALIFLFWIFPKNEFLLVCFDKQNVTIRKFEKARWKIKNKKSEGIGTDRLFFLFFHEVCTVPLTDCFFVFFACLFLLLHLTHDVLAVDECFETTHCI